MDVKDLLLLAISSQTRDKRSGAIPSIEILRDNTFLAHLMAYTWPGVCCPLHLSQGHAV
jgi:hypothetical protein